MSDFLLQTLPYEKNLQHRYQALHTLPGFVLLDSSDTARGRYDILSAYPFDNHIVFEKEIDKAFAVLQQKLPLKSSCGDLPFQGGAIGYISYDLGAALAGVHSHPHPVLSHLPLMNVGFYDWAIIVDHQKKTITLFARLERPEIKTIISEVLGLWKNAKQSRQPTFVSEFFTPLISKQEYLQAFDTIQVYLKKGRSYQVNFTQPFQADFKGSPWEIYQKVRAHNPVPFGAFLQEKDAAILSFSPERFLGMQDKILHTSPIKGTIQSSSCPLEDAKCKQQLLRCVKNRAENVMIVDLLRNDLGKIAKPGSVKVPELCALQSFRGLHHLVSTVEAHCLENIHAVDAFQACFPGGSITGAPKLEAMRIIQEQEAYARGVYCGSIAYFSYHGRMDSNIAIRTITASANLLHLAAGGALVMDSQGEEEYKECFTKISAILNAIRDKS